MDKCRVKINHLKQSLKIFSNKKGHEKIIKFLLDKGCFVKDNRNMTNYLLELDYRGYEMLMKEDPNKIGLSWKIPKELNQELVKIRVDEERNLEKSLQDLEYDFDLRIWEKTKNDSKDYFCEVDGNIYSCNNLKDLISFLKGELLIETNKPITSFSYNPLTVFGIFGFIRDVLSSDKSIISYNFDKKDRKKQFNPVIENTHHMRIVIDGADDTANAMNNTGLPQQTVALIQGLVIFPIFLKGVHLGYEGLGEEAKETLDEYKASHIKKLKIEVKIEKFRRDLCEKCEIDYDSVKNYEPNKFLKEVSKKIHDSDESIKNDIISLACDYKKELEEDCGAPEIRDVLAAHCGWLAMTSMMASVGVYEVQAIINIFEEIDNVTSGAEDSLLSSVGNTFGFAGQILMTIYAFHKMVDERKEWKQAAEELKKFRNAKDVTDLARQITDELLKANRNNHRLQTYGNAALSSGQAMMAVGGPLGLAIPPVLFAGLVFTIGGVVVNSTAEFKYQSAYQIEKDIDDLELSIITRPPQLKKDDFKNITEALARNAKRRMLELEILGHLRAPQFVLYQKFSTKNKNDVGFFGKCMEFVGGNNFLQWLKKPPSASINLIMDNSLIDTHPNNPNDLDIFNVNENDVKNALENYDKLFDEGNSHVDAIKKLQEEFILQKVNDSAKKETKTTKELCQSIIDKNGTSGSYLTKKLMRAVANGSLKYDGSLKDDNFQIKKNGKNIITTKLDLDKFNEEDLVNFLTKKRSQKGLFDLKKKSPLEKAHKNGIYVVKSDHLRPFDEIGKLSSVATNFLESQPKDDLQEVIIKDQKNTNPEKPSNVYDLQKSQEQFSVKKEESLLKELGNLAAKEIACNQEERKQQVRTQNNVINKVLNKSQKFILESKTIDVAKNQTVFVYTDPNYQDPTHVEYEARKVTYIRNDSDGKIDVLYGERSDAFVIERPNTIKNGLIAKIKNNNVECYGQTQGSTFKSFERIKKPNTSVIIDIHEAPETLNRDLKNVVLG